MMWKVPAYLKYLLALQRQVSKVAAPDYHKYVRSEDEMNLDKVEKRVRSGKYTKVYLGHLSS